MNKLTAIAVAFAPFVVISAERESWTLDGTEEEIPSGEMVVVNGNDQSLRLVNGAKLTVRQGATLMVEPSGGYKEGQKLFYMDGIWKDSPQVIRRPSELTIDGGTMNAPLTFWKLSDGAYLKYGILKVTNGGKFLMARPKNSPGMPSMLVEGGSGIVVDKGSTFSITGANTPEKSLILGQGGPSLEVKDKSFFNYYNIWIGGTSVLQRPATGVKVLFEDSTVTTDDQESGDCVVTFYGKTYPSTDNEICITGDLAKVQMNVAMAGTEANVKGNVVRLCGGELTGSFDCSVGTSNRFVQTAGKQTGAMRITGGLNNMIEMNGGESVGKGEDGAVLLTGGTGNKFGLFVHDCGYSFAA